MWCAGIPLAVSLTGGNRNDWLLRQCAIRPVIAERGQPHGTGLGTFRWVLKRAIQRRCQGQ